MHGSDPQSTTWWRDAVIYQVYLRSFADRSAPDGSAGDGLGDIAGIREKLPYLAQLGVDAIWVNPWYPSPLVDGGYDVSDYRAIDPIFGSLAEAEALVAEAHQLGIRVLVDLVPNHTSDKHRWFVDALASPPGSAARDRYVFRPGRGESGDEPPNNWQANFGGAAWRRVTEADGSPGEWYLHLFAPEQPDLNWTNPQVRAEFVDILRFWFDRDVDGIRIDVAHGLMKAPGLPDAGDTNEWGVASHPAWDQDSVHEIYREWRAVADTYDPPRVFVGEAWVSSPARLANYVRPGELNMAFNFDFLKALWGAGPMREIIGSTTRLIGGVRAPTTWVLSNHDVVRHLTRYGRPSGHENDNAGTIGTDLALGERRARAAVLLMLALPGGAYIYQGEELGLPEVEDLPTDVLADPRWKQSGHTDRGRDGCRVPIPWSGDAPPYGFTPDASIEPWLPQPASFAAHTADAQTVRSGSMVQLYTEALRLRKKIAALGDGTMDWVESGADVLAFSRADGFVCIVNMGADPVSLPRTAQVLLASEPLAGSELPSDRAVWLQV